MKRLKHSCFFAPVLMFFAVLILENCASTKSGWPTESQRSDSFKPSQGTLLAGEPISLYLRRRTAVLVSGRAAAATRIKGTTAAIEFEPEPDNVLQCGAAVAIDARGYFVTAAHCVKDPVNYLVFTEGDTARVAIPRVVATLTDSETHLDIALLHVNARLSHVFDWEKLSQKSVGARAIGVGASRFIRIHGNRKFFETVCFGGAVTAIGPAPYGCWVIESDVPARSGDSGGPIVTESGSLLGIHAGIGVGSNGGPGSFAFRPELVWLEKQIEADKQVRLSKTKIEFPEILGGGEAPGVVISLR